ncbi:L-rhamnose mutarotase [Siphonobacter sp. SORGH_AS_1065]|uniref:L-rhamnose mutarotase n=1 Tax=Siphonobacter sp. SORGH_AS_1065 TaxID=3041795 RepID=UPI00278AFAF4|nr:L-rhamnose mutarotase [Siphonobacter sp. SORGH_AS_1065]MDQ1085544.1 L-rhamnose mutarotase [Siphonobacter sp. SORGH_AS_1065]
MKKFCLALDLKDDPELIRQYETYHKSENAWPEVTQSILDSGVTAMEIYRTGNRLFMIMETKDDFDFRVKEQMDRNNAKVMEWEALMSQFQLPLSWSAEHEKWVQMDRIFTLIPA